MITIAVRQACCSLQRRAVRFAVRRSPTLLRASLATVMLWFALPKYVAGLSPVDGLVADTAAALTLGLVDGRAAVFLLAVAETAIAAGLLLRRLLAPTLAALVLHMAGTFTALLLFPDRMWQAPLVPSLEAEFILKNLVLVAAAIAVAASLRPAAASNDTADDAASAHQCAVAHQRQPVERSVR